MCDAVPPMPDAVSETFHVRRELGRGGQGVAYLAIERASGREVVVKRLSLPAVEDWKTVELFEREARVLQALEHERIPAYLDHFVVGQDGGQGDGGAPEFYLVQSYASGTVLDELIAEGEAFDEAQLVEFLEQILAVLVYLQSRNPPVVHRDIKPSNIVRADDGRYFLVDFGSVQEKLAMRGGGSTFAGTSGFMPPEQMKGRAEPASDLYGLGSTAVYLAGGMHPAEMPTSGMALEFRRICELSERLDAFLERLLAPRLDDRFEDASKALEALRSGRAVERPEWEPSERSMVSPPSSRANEPPERTGRRETGWWTSARPRPACWTRSAARRWRGRPGTCPSSSSADAPRLGATCTPWALPSCTWPATPRPPNSPPGTFASSFGTSWTCRPALSGCSRT